MKLKRVLGWTALTFYGVGDILGAGIYALVGKVAGVVGPAAWLSFLAAFVVAALTALSYAEFSSRMPRAAGAAVFTLEAFRLSWLSYIVGFMVLFSGIISMGAASRAFAGYLMGLSPALPEYVIIFFFFLVLAAINFKGIKESSAANVVCTIIELTGLFIVIAAGMKFFGKADLLSIQPAEGNFWGVAVLQGGALAFYAFIGFEDLVNVAEEAKDPVRTMPKAILLSLAIGTIVYILVAISAVSTMPLGELSASKAPLVGVVERSFPGFPIWIFSLIALFAVGNTALLNFIMGSRVLYGMSSDRLVPAFFGRLHAKTGTPHLAILVIWGVALILTYSGTLVVLAQATSLLLLIVFMIVNAALIVIKRREPETEGIFKVPIVVPLLGIFSTAGLMFFLDPRAFKVVGVILLIIAIAYFFSRRRYTGMNHSSF